MVVDLAALQPDDIAAVLAELSEEQRGTVERLLRDFSGFGFGGPTPPPEARAYDVIRLSPWLVQKLESNDGMTDRARTALRECALELFPVGPKDASASDLRRMALGDSRRRT